MMKMMEVYAAPQGEGQFIGAPSTFVRFFGCNLRCSWCDTAYSINRKEYAALDEPKTAEPYELVDTHEIVRICDVQDRRHVVLTGGEPTIQPDFIELLRQLYHFGFLVTIETNGTTLPEGIQKWYGESWDKSQVLWSVAPKLPSAAEGGRVWYSQDALRWFAAQATTQLKFVVAGAHDFNESMSLIAKLEFPVYKIPIIFQPEGSVITEGVDMYLEKLGILQTMVLAMPFWREYDCRVLPQLHTMIHGQKRMV